MNNAIQRVRDVLEGRHPDSPPVSFWYHFRADQVAGRAAVEAHLAHLQRFDLDFLKVMNDNGYPHESPVAAVADLAGLVDLRGDEPAFARQLELLAALRKELAGRVLMTSTIFNAYAVLRQLIRRPTVHRPPDLRAELDEPTRVIKQMIAEDPGAVRRAIDTIGRNLARFARRCLEAGADGIFLSVRDDWLDANGAHFHQQFVRDSDLAILSAAATGSFNVLHVCGRAVNFDRFAEYPVHVINWADRAAGPSIAQVKDRIRPALCGGVDNLSTLPHGTAEDVRREVADALAQAGDRPILIAPGCTYDPALVPETNLRAIVEAARSAR